MNVTLTEPHEAQQKILNEAQRFNVVNCGRRWGKSVLAENLLAETALEGYPAGYFTPTYKLRNEIFDSLVMRLAEVTTKVNRSENIIQLSTGGKIEFWSLQDRHAGRSRKYKRSVLDEVAFSDNLEDAWTKAVRPTLTDLIGDAWFMSTPAGRNYFYTLCQMAQDKPNWSYWQMPTSTNPYIDLNEIKEAEENLPAFAFRQEYLAEFSENEDNPFGYEYIDAAKVKELSTKEPIYFGIDVAAKIDYTVIIGLDEDGAMAYYDRFQRPITETEGIIESAVKDNRAIIDSTGLGAQMTESLRKSCVGLQGMRYTGGKGDNSKFKLINGLITALNKFQIKVLESEVTKELYNFTYLYKANGDLTFNAPSGLHDDCVNALALAVKCMNLAPVYQSIRIGDDIIEP